MPTERIPLLTVYSRKDCHLCEEMTEALQVLQGLVSFKVEVVDVDADPELERRFGEKVPVLAHEGRELCHYRLDTAAVTAYVAKIR